MPRCSSKRQPRSAAVAAPGPIGLACGSTTRAEPVGPAFTLSVVSPYPGGAPDEYLDGQAVAGFEHAATAVAACRRYARDPSRLPRFDVPGATLLVVTDRAGNEVCRRPLLGVVSC